MKSWWSPLSRALAERKALSITIMLIGSLTMIGWISLDKLTEVFHGQTAIQTLMDLEREISLIGRQYRDAKPEALQTNLVQADQLLIQDFINKILKTKTGILLGFHHLDWKKVPFSIRNPGKIIDFGL